MREPLITQISAETSHHGISSSTCGLFWFHLQFNSSNYLTFCIAFTDTEFCIIRGLCINNQITILDAAKVYICILQPTTLLRQIGLIATESIYSINKFRCHAFTRCTITVNFYLLGSLVDTHATHGFLHLLNSSIRIEVQFINLYRATLVITRRESILMIEQIPLTLIINDTMVISPTTILMFRHDDTFVFIGAHWILTHSISKNLSILSYIRIGKIVIAIILKSKWPFCLTAGQTFKAIHA